MNYLAAVREEFETCNIRKDRVKTEGRFPLHEYCCKNHLTYTIAKAIREVKSELHIGPSPNHS